VAAEAGAAEAAGAPGKGVAGADILRWPRPVGTLCRVDERDVTILMQAVFEIKCDIRDLLDLFREEDDDGQEEADGAG